MAIQAIDRLYDCLRQLAPRPFPDGVHRDEKGNVRLVTHAMTWDDYVHLAFDEIRMAGAGSPQVARRLRAALEDLLTIAPQERKSSLEEQLDLLQSGVQDAIAERADVSLMLRKVIGAASDDFSHCVQLSARTPGTRRSLPACWSCVPTPVDGDHPRHLPRRNRP